MVLLQINKVASGPDRVVMPPAAAENADCQDWYGPLCHHRVHYIGTERKPDFISTIGTSRHWWKQWPCKAARGRNSNKPRLFLVLFFFCTIQKYGGRSGYDNRCTRRACSFDLLQPAVHNARQDLQQHGRAYHF